jgi:hypothetical protein
MALQASTKSKLTLLLTLIRNDAKPSAALHGAARRRLNTTDAADVRSIAPIDGSGARDATATTALDAILADIAAN